jgi:murein DD-endopeptidase MepM/ murein hydrolase activator NlpD
VWLAANGPSPSTGHRRALVVVEGAPHIAQRFAIDYLKVNAEGRSYVGDRLKNASYLAYGADALAVADGRVVAVKDSIPENIPGSRAVPITLETVGGNHVILDLGDGHYAFYAHLQPGSIRVRIGERVRTGQVLGLVGNSGNSTEPHLHFHVSDANSPLGSEGIPYIHQSVEIVGRCQALISGCSQGPPSVRTQEMPMANELVRFPE